MLVGFTRYSRDQSFAVIGRNRLFLLTMAAGSIIGTFIGGQLLGMVPGGLLLPLLACILLISAVKIWRHGTLRFVVPHRRVLLHRDVFDIGVTTRKALERFERTEDPFDGPTDERQAGNGSLMRLAPVALFALDDPAEAIRIAREQSRLTHAAPQCVDACDYFVQLLRSTILGGGHPSNSGVGPATPTWSTPKRPIGRQGPQTDPVRWVRRRNT